jgi:uncharacterized protein (DUF2141 family)
MNYFVFCLCLLFLLCPGLDGEESGGFALTIQVSGAESSAGHIHLYIFTSKTDYLKVPMKGKHLSVDEEGGAVFNFKLSEGKYSICAFHDKNGNGKLDKGFLGIPTELFAFSNQAKGLFGPPSYQSTLFELNKDTTLKLRLGKAKD